LAIILLMSGRSLIFRLEGWMKKYHLPLMPVIWGATWVIAGGLVALGIYGYHSAEKAMAEQFNRQQLILAQQAARGMEIFLKDLRQTISLLVRLPEAQNLVGGESQKDQVEILRTLYQNAGGGIDFLFWVDTQGRLKSTYPANLWREKGGENFNLRPYFQKAHLTDKAVIFHVSPPLRKEPVQGPVPSFGSILIASPFFHESKFIGLLGCGVDFRKTYERFVHPMRFGVQAGSWMINQEGKFIAHYDADLLGKDAFTARKERDPRLSPERIDRIMKEEMLAGKAGTDEYVSGWHMGRRGRLKKLIAYAPIRLDDQVWSVALVVPYSQVTHVVWGRFKTSAVLILIMAGTLLGGTYVGHKINQERIRAEEKVRWGEEILKSQNRLQAIFDGAPDAIIIVDRNCRVLSVNKTGLNWYQRPLEDFVGKPCYGEFQNRSDLCPNCPGEESFRTGQPAFRERASLVAGGNKYYLQIFTFPLRNRNGEVVEVVEYVKDVTAEKELQRQIIQSERLAVVGRMSANVAHEIRNPLGTIVLNAELLEEELDRLESQDRTEARELLGVMKSELDRLTEVVEEYLQFARLPKVKLESGRVNAVISDLLFFLKEEFAERKVLVVEELDPSLPSAQLDPKQLRQALLNIIKNSMEAMPEGGKLTISTAQKDGKAEITVGDTGKGILEENLELVFTPFFSTKHGGTGLGLSITSHIIKEHRGTISFQSYPGLGTAFTIRLPLMHSSAGVEEGAGQKG
jgi:signal transduction histidine kinase